MKSDSGNSPYSPDLVLALEHHDFEVSPSSNRVPGERLDELFQLSQPSRSGANDSNAGRVAGHFRS